MTKVDYVFSRIGMHPCWHMESYDIPVTDIVTIRINDLISTHITQQLWGMRYAGSSIG